VTRLSWLRSLLPRPVSRPIRKAPDRRRPRVEALEDRLVPAAYHVISLADDGSAGTLRDAITQANANPGPDTIDFQVGGTIQLPQGELLVLGSLTITGPGASDLVIDAGRASRVPEVRGTADLDSVTLTNGSDSHEGGAVLNFGNLTVVNCTISNSSATRVFDSLGGGIFNHGSLAVINSTMSGCTSGELGGAIYNSGSLSITNSTVSNNKANPIGSADNIYLIQQGGGIYNCGTATVTNSTLSGNTSGRGAASATTVRSR
jgi:hypothetical protein